MMVSVISGSQLGVSGPAAGLTTLVGASIISLGNFQTFLLAVIVAGLFQIVLGLLKMGLIANYFPSAVIKGMLAAIGIILISKQIPLALGYDQPDFWTSGFIKLFSHENIMGNILHLNQHLTRGTILISIVSIAILIYLNQPSAKKFKVIPAPLLVVVIGIALNLILANNTINLQLKPTQLVTIPNNLFGNIVFPDFSLMFSKIEIWTDGIMIGILASLETLL